MGQSSWLPRTLAAVMIAIAVYSAGRLAAARLWRRATHQDEDITHVVMGVAMAGMFVPALNPLPDGVWEIAFAIGTVWFAWGTRQLLRAGGGLREGGYADHHMAHLIHNTAMLYMLLALRAPASHGPAAGMASMDGMGAMVRFPALALVFALLLLGNAVWDADRLTAMAAAGHGVAALAVAAAPGRVPAGALIPVTAAGGGGRRARRRGHTRAGGRGGGAGRGAAGPASCRLLPDRDGYQHGVHADTHAVEFPAVADSGHETGHPGRGDPRRAAWAGPEEVGHRRCPGQRWLTRPHPARGRSSFRSRG